ncbi:type I restriction endonuclease subunit R, partial [Candidatus Dependentiae bacterium]|nr:type I restriction endonuclease subunit R [Candidatus Dependentiae bacterium]
SLDKQIYGNFASCGAVTEKKVHATNCNHLKRLLKEDHRNIFTLIQKFQEEEGKEFPVLSERDDIIVITDESHRSQYEVLAMNMRTALPNASFIAFTGTPLIVGEEKTREVFGEYVSIYNFKQSIDDGATLPIYYEKRKPEVNIINDQINQEFYDIIKDKNLEEEEEEKLETLFAKKYYLITDDDRLEIIAEDIVNHFMNRGYMGKAMVVCIDKVTTVKMYDKVKKYWGKYIKNKNRLPRHSIPRNDKENLIENSCFNSVDEMINYMKETEMYVVVSEEQFEEKKFKDKGLDIRFHRQQMQINDLDTRFKEPTDPFRIVFVCAMWMTGFDAKSLSTMYLDKPLVNHNLMQSIARVNRVYGDKSNGIIVDYIGIFDNLKKALAVYGSDPSGVIQPGEMPVQPKIKLIEQLREIQIHLFQVFKDHQIDLERLYHINGLELIRELEKTSDKILSDKDFKKEFKEISNRIMKLFKMILPDITANEFLRLISTIKLLRNIILESTITDPELKGKIEDLLEKSIDAEKVKQPLFPDFQIDLTKLDFSMLKKSFIEGRRFLTADRLRRALEDKVKKMLEQNKFRVELYEKLLRIIEEYNSGAADIEKYFKDLTKLAKQLEKEEKRHIQEGLSEEELVIFDLLYKEKLTKKENIKLKNIAKELLEILKREKLVLDWRKKQQTRAAVELTIEEELEKLIPEILAQKQLDKVTKEMFQYIYEKYPGG